MNDKFIKELPTIGTRVISIQPIYRHGSVDIKRVGWTGRVIRHDVCGDPAVVVKLDFHFEQLNEWKNEIHFTDDADEGRDAILADYEYHFRAMTDAEILNRLRQSALNAACKAIQDETGQTDGGLAGIYFSNEEEFAEIFDPYINAELEAENERGPLKPRYLIEFPGFVIAPEALEFIFASNFEDVSWHNDECPSFMNNEYCLWVSDDPEAPFSLTAIDEEKQHIDSGAEPVIFKDLDSLRVYLSGEAS